MSSPEHAHQSDTQSPFIRDFVAQFCPAGIPSERTMVRLFIEQHRQSTGQLPRGRQQLAIDYRDETVLGRWIDFTPLHLTMAATTSQINSVES